MALALELDAIEALRFGKPDHGVGELDLAASAVFLGFEKIRKFPAAGCSAR